MAKRISDKNPQSGKRKLGKAKGLFKLDKSFFEPLPKDILESFYK